MKPPNPDPHGIPGDPGYVTLRDFRPALEAMLETESTYCLVGGLAVGQWAEALLTPEERKRFEIPIRSKDIDIRASKSDAMMLVKNLNERGAVTQGIFKRVPKDGSKSFPSIAVSIKLPQSGGTYTSTTVEALSGMPLLDVTGENGFILNRGTAMRYGKISLLDPCSLLICKLNAIRTRPPGQSDNDRTHADILTLVIPRFIEKTLERMVTKKDDYHPYEDSNRLAEILGKKVWSELIAEDQKDRILSACQKARDDMGVRGFKTGERSR